MKVRYASIDDVQVITDHNILLAKESEHLVLDYSTVSKGVTSLLSDNKKGFYIVAEEDGKIIGQLMITIEWSDWRNSMMWWIQSVYVHKNYRRSGVFTQLLQHIKLQASKQGVSVLRLYVHDENTSAKKVYQTVGMQRQPYTIYQLETENY